MPKTSASIDLTRRVDDALVAFISSERDALEPEAQPLLAELGSLIASGGKRLRPRFCYWGFRAAGGDAEGPRESEIIRVGAALELLHTMALIHDDVMDRSTKRRNRASTASVFGALAELSADSERPEHRGDPQRFGASAAILTGMLGFVLADRLFGLARVAISGSGGGSGAAAERYDRLRTRAIAGQYLDLLSAHRGQADEATTRRVASLKSGSYSVADPLAIGALLAGGTDAVVAALEAYGQPLGEAFQIRDDVLSTFGDPSATGKDADGDLREGKQTVLLAKARTNADDEQRDVIESCVGDPDLTHEDADRVRGVIVATGALADTERLVAELTTEAKRAIAEASIDARARDALLRLADEATTRHS
jgi:geranylgeranyl diphosphate synthase type I